MTNYKITHVNKNLFVKDYGNKVFELFIKLHGPIFYGAIVYRYEKGKLKWCQKKGTKSASTPRHYNFFKRDY